MRSASEQDGGRAGRRSGLADLLVTALRARRPRHRGIEAASSVEDLRQLARRRLPRGPFDYLDGGAEDEVALRRNTASFAEWQLVGRALRDVAHIDATGSVLGTPSPLPLVCAPTGFGRIFHHEGERAVARAANRMGIPYALSTLGTVSLEECARHAGPARWFQLYVMKDRGITSDLIARAKASGYQALVLTVDTPVAGRRERDIRNGFTIPPQLGLRALLDGARKPAWWLGYLRSEALSFATVAPYAPTDTGPEGVMGYINQQFDRSLSWDDAVAIREEWGGPFAIKGIQHVDDARNAVEIGADAIMLSNHGGRQLDHAVAPLELLPELADAVGGQVELILDGGVRRGTDVVKALALGASACAIGRAYLYGLAAAGEHGVYHALRLLEKEMHVAMSLMGCRVLGEIDGTSVRQSRGPGERAASR